MGFGIQRVNYLREKTLKFWENSIAQCLQQQQTTQTIFPALFTPTVKYLINEGASDRKLNPDLTSLAHGSYYFEHTVMQKQQRTWG